MKELILIKEWMLIRHMHQKSVIFVAIGICKIKALNFNKMLGMDAMIYFYAMIEL